MRLAVPRDSFWGKVALAARRGRPPLLRITAPRWLACVLLAAGAQRASDSEEG